MSGLRFPTVSEKEPKAEGVVSTWFVADGEQVAEGQLIAEVQVEKVSAEVHAPSAGTVHLKVAEGEVVHQGDVIAVIDP